MHIKIGLQKNKLVYILASKNIGKIFVPISTPVHLIPYLALIKSEKK